MIKIGDPIPDVALGSFKNDEIVVHSLHDLLKGQKNMIVGLPGVFTPICTGDHLPRLIENSSILFSQGFKNIFCICDDNPWAIDVWKRTIIGHEKLVFLSDGNREFLDKVGLPAHEDDLFLAGKYARFTMMVDDNIVQNLNIEDNVLDMTCTSGEEYCVA